MALLLDSLIQEKYETHAKDLPGRPDFVFRSSKIVVFVDGVFWRGWRFPAWGLKLTEKWEEKLEATRKRDKRNRAKLRRDGWNSIRIWEHQLKRRPSECQNRVRQALNFPPGSATSNLVSISEDSRPGGRKKYDSASD